MIFIFGLSLLFLSVFDEINKVCDLSTDHSLAVFKQVSYLDTDMMFLPAHMSLSRDKLITLNKLFRCCSAILPLSPSNSNVPKSALSTAAQRHEEDFL